MFGEVKVFLAKIIKIQGARVQVQYANTKSDFVAYMQAHNALKTHFAPPAINEVVVYFKTQEFGFCIGSFLPKDYTPDSENLEVAVFKDGTRIEYESGILRIQSLKELNIECQNAQISAQNAQISAQSVLLDSENIDLGNGGAGVVTGECICPFTGSPHADISAKVRAAK